jgi:uridine phosphorylase
MTAPAAPTSPEQTMPGEGAVAEHLRVRRDQIGRYVLLPGDPGRCEPIARLFDEPRHVATNREYVTWTGTLLGETVSVVSTGIGCPSAAIATEELSRLGADTFIRVGTSGGMQPFCGVGDLAIVSAAIRDEGTTSHYLPMEFPAVANLDVIEALREAARRTGARAHVGVSQSKDSFYGEIDPDASPVAPRLHERWDAWVRGGAICSEMEAAAIFTVAAIQRRRAGGVMVMAGNLDMLPEELEAAGKQLTLDTLIGTAVEALRVLIARDRVAVT